MELVIALGIGTVGVLVASYIVPGVEVESLIVAVVVAVVMGVLNTVVKPVLVALTLPVTVVTMGLFLLVINVALIYLAAWLVPGFAVAGFFSALFFSIIVTIVVSFLTKLNA